MSDTAISIRTGTLSRVTLSLNETSLTVQTPSKSKDTIHHDIPHRNILRASLGSNPLKLTVAFLEKKKKKTTHLAIVEGDIEESEVVHATQWAESVMKAAYESLGVKPFRRLMVFVNPFGGTKKGAAIFTKKIAPIFEIAGCSLDVLYTTHQGQAQEIAKKLPLDFDAVITVSGDGLIHEILNGFAEHAEPSKALATPIAPIPTGSGNGLSLNLLGIKDGFDVVVAALNAIKGEPMKVDLFSVTQGGKRTISFMSQAVGLMADLDIGTENLRWMGDTRFMYGLLRGLIKFKPCPVQLSFKVAENDKDKMAATVYSIKKDKTPSIPPSSAASETSFHDKLPSLKFLDGNEEDWTTFDEPILYVYAGKGPYVGRDFMAFPVSLPNDGLIDVMAMSKTSRGDILTAMDGANQGECFWHPKVHYVKAHAYRIKPLKKKGHLAVDGEPYPFEEFQVEVHEGLGTFLSPFGHYAAMFEPRTRSGVAHKHH
ncbi:hypothetical protein GALMADRAFT_239721 [Galerina marginata CBS 339.88]|uniref:DAGKc domain-containing protein n=1 Tax=Galerina marginata (strain CBS 339.88) TaxID=685588 RepID=A0A067TEJ6_GALM3|nr:hypothetical protein GALMADRAFT_239721 [Galerina marginata CBS 339.88]